MKLTIELVPRSAWYKNLRTHVGAAKWKTIATRVYQQANHKCEVCGGKGNKWPVEAHEVWIFENNKIILERMIALCPSCHEVKHIGLASIKGRLEVAKKHLMKVNDMTNDEADDYIMEAFELFEERSKHKWDLDISSISQYL